MTAAHAAKLVVLSGPSGVGKGSVHAALRERLPRVVVSVSVTTRAARPGERHGADYLFVDDDAFDRLVAEGALLEHATYAGHRYGTPRHAVTEALAQGHTVILDIDVQGALQVREAMPDAMLIFLLPPSMGELERRLRQRGTESDAAIAQRLERARQEIALAERFDTAVINEDLATCVEAVRQLVVDACDGAR